MLRDGSWKTADFKSYNYNAVGAPVGGGYFQPLLKVRAEFRKILMGMGFEEMPTSKWVESSFWNFDALFQPQSHPARDAHDTFFVKEPASTLKWPADYYERVKNMHVSGGSGSIGHRCPFDENEARKQILRTHTTAVSARMLYQLANREGGFRPAKYFSIDRVFRNETMVCVGVPFCLCSRRRRASATRRRSASTASMAQWWRAAATPWFRSRRLRPRDAAAVGRGGVDGVLWRGRDAIDAVTPSTPSPRHASTTRRPRAGLDAPLRVPPGRGPRRGLRPEFR